MTPRRLRSLSATALLLGLLAVPGASASDLDVVSARVEAGTLDGVGPLAAFHVWNADGSAWSLEAPQATATVIRQTTDVVIEGVFRSDAGATRNSTTHAALDLSAQSLEGAVLMVRPTGPEARVSVHSQDVTVRPSDREVEPATMRPSSESSMWNVPVEDTVMVTAKGSRVEVSGDFTVLVWSALVDGSDDQGPVAYTSGRDDEAIDPLGTASSTTDTYLRIHVQAGTFALRTPAASDLVTFAPQIDLSGSDAVLRSSTGRVADVAVDGSDVTIEGDFSFRASVDEGRVRMVAQDGLGSLAVEGRNVAPVGASVPALWSWGVGLLAAASFALFLRSRRITTFDGLLAVMDRRSYRRVVRHADRVLVRTQNEAVAAMKAVALMALGRPRDALGFLKGLPDHLRPADGMGAFLRAHASVDLDRTEDAREYLHLALAENPSLIEEAIRFPKLRALLDGSPPEAYA